MTADSIGVGVVGIGFGQSAHVPAFRAAGCAVVALAASLESRARAVADRLDVDRAYGDWRLLVADPEVRVVSIAVPPALQPEIAIAAARAGKAIFCEKPIAVSARDAERMVEAVSAAGVASAVDFEFPELPAWRRARELVSAGGVGRLFHLYVDWRVRTRPREGSWKDREDAGGGALGGFVSHALHHVEWLGARVIGVQARTRSSGGAAAAYDLWLRLDGGANATITVATDVVGGSGHRVEICGDRGTLTLENRGFDHAGPFTLSRSDAAGRETIVSEVDDTGTGGDRRMRAVSSVVARFVEAVRGGPPMRPDLADGLRVQELLDAARAAAGRSD